MTLVTNSAAISTPAVTHCLDSRFVVVWQDINGVDLKARFITAQGEVDGPEFQINTTPNATRPAAMQRSERAFGQSEFTVAWNRKDTAQADIGQVLMQRFSGDGTKVGGEIVVSSTTANVTCTPVIVRLSNQIVVAWATAGTGFEGLRASFFKPDGTKVREVRIDARNPVNIGPIAGAALLNGTFAIVWHGGDNVATAHPHLQILKSDGTTIGPETTPNIKSGQLAMSLLVPFLAEEQGAFVVAFQEMYLDDLNTPRTQVITK